MGDQDLLNQPDKSFDEALEEVTSQYNGNCTLTDLEDMVTQMLTTIPKMDRDAIRREMQKMEVPMFQAPTTFDINRGLTIAQGYKDRLTEIINIAMQEYKLRKRCVEMLFDAVNVVSKQSSADKRKGEATMKYPIHVLALESADIFIKEVEQILNNIKSASDSISRQGSIIQSQIQLGEYRKKLPTDFNNAGGAEEQQDYHSGAPKVNMGWDDI